MRRANVLLKARGGGRGRGGTGIRRPLHSHSPTSAPHEQPVHRRGVPLRVNRSRLELHLDGRVDVQAAAAGFGSDALRHHEEHEPPVVYDCLGLAQAMVDIAAAVDDELLDRLQLEKGSRRLVTLEERADLLAGLEGLQYSVAAGGSLSNSLLGLARLGQAAADAHGEPPLRVAMAGLIGDDPLGGFYRAQMAAAGVHVASPPLTGAATGTVLVLTSPDAQRTMCSYLGTAAEVEIDAQLEAAIARSRLLVVEGYLWELPGAQRTVAKAIASARRHGCVVAMTAGDAGVVHRHHAAMWSAIDAGVDLLFTNAGEAAALLQHEPQGEASQADGEAAAAAAGHCATGEQLALRLGPHCSMVVVTDGDKGSYVTALGQLHCVPPCWLDSPPVDTCGAGDAYAAGLLYAYLRHHDLLSMGRTAARVASAVISKHGATLTPEAAAALTEALPHTEPLRLPTASLRLPASIPA